jgi:predicted nucleic acid-binding protein
MELVVDTSVLLAVLLSEPERAKLVALTANADLIAPASVHWEVGNALSSMLKRQRITIDQAMSVLAAYDQIPIRLIDVSLKAAVTIAAELNMYAYDAYVIACARDQRIGLLSLDKALVAAAKQAGVTSVEVP